jgi:predicted nucleic acid-binding protein
LEFANAISASRARERFELILSRLRLEEDATIIEPQPELFESVCQLYISRTDKDWSLTDCISFVVMQRDGLTDALTADRYFVQAGFNALLRA